ncbi:MAG: hypothetical protein RQ760_10920 [Sedimentisphaerales bacterium]|nr:hypothetical protein [Sedimentisphaerales bacterium]
MRIRVYKSSGLIRNISTYFLAGITLLVLCSLSVYMVSLSTGQSSIDREELIKEEKLLYAWVNVNIVDTVNRWLVAAGKENDQLYDTYLVFDTELKRIYFEKDRAAFVQESVELPDKYDWKLYHITPNGVEELTDIVRLKNRRNRQNHYNIYKEAVVLQARISGDFGVNFIFEACRALGSGTGILRLDDYPFNDKFYEETEKTVNESILVSEEEYLSRKL